MIKTKFLKLFRIFIKIMFLFNLDNCFGGSLIAENLEPTPPTKITADIEFIILYYNRSNSTHLLQCKMPFVNFDLNNVNIKL